MTYAKGCFSHTAKTTASFAVVFDSTNAFTVGLHRANEVVFTWSSSDCNTIVPL